MKIYTQKQITQIENQALNKIYNALEEFYEKFGEVGPGGEMKDRHDVILDIALNHLHSKPTGNVYGWIKKGNLKGYFHY